MQLKRSETILKEPNQLLLIPTNLLHHTIHCIMNMKKIKWIRKLFNYMYTLKFSWNMKINCNKIDVALLKPTLSSAAGVLFPLPLWSNKIILYTSGSKNLLSLGLVPPPGPPCLIQINHHYYKYILLVYWINRWQQLPSKKIWIKLFSQPLLSQRQTRMFGCTQRVYISAWLV